MNEFNHEDKVIDIAEYAQKAIKRVKPLPGSEADDPTLADEAGIDDCKEMLRDRLASSHDAITRVKPLPGSEPTEQFHPDEFGPNGYKIEYTAKMRTNTTISDYIPGW